MTIEELENQYSRIPLEIKKVRRWVGYKIEIRDDKKTKIPYNAINGAKARSNDPDTWTSFDVACFGCVKYGFNGIGFMLGDGYFGVDLDNHEDASGQKAMTREEFLEYASDFINTLQSYTEYSPSGEGIHIICKGSLPEGANKRRNGVPVEMYDRGRFFTMTGNVISALPINERTGEIAILWEKYLKIPEREVEQFDGLVFGENRRSATVEITPSNLTDYELISRIRSSRFGNEFNALYNGDMSAYGNDHSAADFALCKILAFWTGCDQSQMDRIFRTSALMRSKWDKNRGDRTYGELTLDRAISDQREVYKPAKEKVITIESVVEKTTAPIESETEIVQFDEKNDPIITVKQIFRSYPLNDTGNAERFYDYFGEYFKFNKDNNCFMFWNGKTWSRDVKEFVRKYANKLIDILKDEVKNTGKKIEEALKLGEDGVEQAKDLKALEKAQLENIKRVSNKAGKDAMLSELHSLHDMPVVNSEFDTQENLLNTDSGVVDLYTGEVHPFDKNYMLSKNTNCKVDFTAPKVFLKFLRDIFKREKPEETEELIDTVQMALGESATGRTNKEHLHILYGHGSNGKSTFVETVNNVFGEYGTTMNSDMLIQKQNSSSQSNEFSLASLLGARMVSTSETAEGKRLDEVMIKQMLSGEKLTAQFKYGMVFSFKPTFSPWMSTNNKPIIRATDFGTWRRIFFWPFLNTFTEETKDVDMPKKLAAESAQILGWIIQGAVKLHKEYKDKLPKPKCLEEALADYKKELDVLSTFLSDMCIVFPGMKIEAPKLYQTYKEWARNNSEYLFSESRFKQEIPKKGFKLERDKNRGWLYVGLKLASDEKGLVFGDD